MNHLLNLLFLPVICASFNAKGEIVDSKSKLYSDAFIVNDKVVCGIKDEFLSYEELRIYNSDNYNCLDASIFTLCGNLNTLMISKCITSIINQEILNNLSIDIYYTGSQLEADNINLFDDELNYYDYGCDEGFFNFWKDNIKSDELIFCDFTDKQLFQELLIRYKDLKKTDDYNYVSSYVDGVNGETINEEIRYLESRFNPSSDQNQTKEADRNSMFIVILIVASLGMSAITIFYFLKQKNVID